MKTNKIKQWAALLLTFSGMAALPLTASAVIKNVVTDESGTVDIGGSYDNNSESGWYALQVEATGVYAGQDIVTSSSTAHGWSPALGVGGTATINGFTANTYGPSDTGANVEGVGARLTLSRVNINTYGDNSLGIRAVNGGLLMVTGGTVTTHGAGNAYGFHVGNSSTAIYTDLTVRGMGARGLGGVVSRGGYLELNRTSVTSDQNMALFSEGAMLINSSTLTGFQGISLAGDSSTVINNSNITVTGTTAAFDLSVDPNWPQATAVSINLTVTGGTATGSGGLLRIGDGPDHATISATFNNVDTSHSGGVTSLIGNGNVTIAVNGGSGIHGDVVATGSGVTTLNLGNSQILGNVTTGSNSTTNVSLDNNSAITGDINGNDGSVLTVDVNQSQLTGNVTGGDGSVLTVRLENSSTMAGNITASGSSDILLSVNNNSYYSGDISDSSTGIIDIYITDNSRGKGNWNHGNLTMDNTSIWEFTSGTSVIDNLNNDGELIFDVNTDDGSHATLNVTGTASGSGQLNVNVTGTTQITEDQKNDILNNLVTGSAQGSWNFDNGMDWGGLIEEEVVVGPDGSLYLKPNGKLNTAGNIATGLIAAQKGSWFAQQNSLLKRMGEIRLLNDAYTQTLAGKDDDKTVTLSAKNIIDNVWIRAYGQQLNFNASVTGQAFKQYVYGTDIGTDHKFTLNNSNVLYTGIFAGYGAADTDHKHNGSKSDISNYYAGLYASLLNNSGWYADATLKGQYTNNTLNGNNGITSFNGSYHNWSVGGSIELGKQFKFQDDWFIEPQFQANYVHILASDYTLSQGLNVNVSDLDAFQLRLGVVAGRTLKLKNGGALQPYVKVSGVEMLSTGGKLTAMGNTVRPNLDGARAELGAGIIWQLDAHNQLHLDYEASFGDKYDKPWGLTAGYRYQF